MGLLQLQLARVPGVVGIYGATKDQFPVRMAWLHPEAAAAYQAAAKALGLRVSDMLRTAEESLRAMAEKTGVQPPGYSAHNYGLAIDVAVDAALAQNKLRKPELDAALAAYGWWCHRKDGKRGLEDWHYNYLGTGPAAQPWLAACATATSRAQAIETRIVALYADQLLLTPVEAQEALAKLRLYSGELDGKFGGGSKQALMAFQRAWRLQPSGQLDARTERTLAYVTAEIREAPMAAPLVG